MTTRFILALKPEKPPAKKTNPDGNDAAVKPYLACPSTGFTQICAVVMESDSMPRIITSVAAAMPDARTVSPNLHVAVC